MIGKLLLLCVVAVGVLGMVALLIELKKRLVARREAKVLARAHATEVEEKRRAYAEMMAAMPRSSISMTLIKLEDSAGFAIPDGALASPPAAPSVPRPVRGVAARRTAVAITRVVAALWRGAIARARSAARRTTDAITRGVASAWRGGVARVRSAAGTARRTAHRAAEGSHRTMSRVMRTARRTVAALARSAAGARRDQRSLETLVIARPAVDSVRPEPSSRSVATAIAPPMRAAPRFATGTRPPPIARPDEDTIVMSRATLQMLVPPRMPPPARRPPVRRQPPPPPPPRPRRNDRN